MFVFIIQIAVLIAIAFILGCLIGAYFAKCWKGAEEQKQAKPLREANVSPAMNVGLDTAKNKQPDNLKLISGVGKVIEKKLNAAGIFYFTQIASWSLAEQSDFSERLSFKGRIVRENWVDQAKALASGEKTEFSKRAEKGEVVSSSNT